MKQTSIVFILFCCTFLAAQFPDFDFITAPVDLMQNYYDYMPGSYYSTPVQVEADGSVYVIFQAKETESSNRRIYYAYINSSGVIQNLDFVGNQDIWEGYPSIDIDPISGDPFVAWHGDYDITTAEREIMGTYDEYHLGNIGNWMEPFSIIDDSVPSPNGVDDEFIWPEVHIGPSPIAGKRRFYVIARNSYSFGDPSENLMICHADLGEDDIANHVVPEWTYNTIPVLNSWNSGNPIWARPFLSCAVSDDGKIAFMGYVDTSTESDSLIVFANDNYGIGDYQYISQEAHYITELQNQEYIFKPIYSRHFSTVFNGSNKLETQLNLAMHYDDGNGNCYYYDKQIFPYIFQYDIPDEEFHFKIANCQINANAANPNYEWEFDQIYLPWDTDNDGQIDEVDANGDPVLMQGWPIYYYYNDTGFHENLSKIAVNEEKGWIAHIWQDGLKAKLAEEGVPGYDDWLEKPEIAICISADHGETWSKPFFLNANETPELAGMIPEYIYPGDIIEDLGNNHGKLHLFFLDDYDFGNNFSGGMQKYCSLDIDFGPFTSSPEIIQTSQIEISNYPNPFNPTTTISFNLTTEITENTEIKIYNLKGQKVKTIPVPESQSLQVSVVWNGTDENNKLVSSGVYFAKLKAGNQIATSKMILMK